MSLWSSLSRWFDFRNTTSEVPEIGCSTNPATGLPMVGGCAGIDLAGNTYGANLQHDDYWSKCTVGSETSFDNLPCWDSTTGSSWDE
jgi:hypothetical protein